MSDLVLAAKIASRFMRSAATHFEIDPEKVRIQLAQLNDSTVKGSLDLTQGGHYEYSFAMVSLSKITIPEVWKPAKLPPLAARMQFGQPIDPIRLGKDNDGTFFVEDGIHRTNLSQQLNFTEVPAIISQWNPIRGIPPEHPKLEVGAWVHLKQAMRDGDNIYQYGYVLEQVGLVYIYGMRRHLYTVACVNQHSTVPDLDRMNDTEFMPVSPPSWGDMVKARVRV